jgi:hypothetical protein
MDDLIRTIRERCEAAIIALQSVVAESNEPNFEGCTILRLPILGAVRGNQHNRDVRS